MGVCVILYFLITFILYHHATEQDQIHQNFKRQNSERLPGDSKKNFAVNKSVINQREAGKHRPSFYSVKHYKKRSVHSIHVKHAAKLMTVGNRREQKQPLSKGNAAHKKSAVTQPVKGQNKDRSKVFPAKTDRSVKGQNKDQSKVFPADTDRSVQGETQWTPPPDAGMPFLFVLDCDGRN